MEFGLKELLFGIAGVSLIGWVAVIGLWHTYMFPRFFQEDSSKASLSSSGIETGNQTAVNQNAGSNKAWFVDDEGDTLNPQRALTAIGLGDRGQYTKKSFVVANFNPIDASYGVNGLYTTVLIGLAISSFILITYGLQSGFGLVGVNL